MAPCINPFTAPACKLSELKSAQTCLQTVYFSVLCQTNLFVILCILTEILSDAKVRKKIRLNDFTFCVFIGHF